MSDVLYESTGRVARLTLNRPARGNGDGLSRSEALEWGLAIEAPVPEELDQRTEELVERIARVPLNQLQMMKLLVDQAAKSSGWDLGCARPET